jgi:hypothetical protein
MLELIKQHNYAFALLAAAIIALIFLISSGFLKSFVVGTIEFALLLFVLAYAGYAAFFRKLPLM